MNQTVVTSLAELEQHLSATNCSRIFLVTDEPAYSLSGAKEQLEPIFSRFEYTRFSDFEPNPKFEDVQTGLRLLGEVDSTLVVAVGGGTAIDIAKLICCFASQPNKITADSLSNVCRESNKLVPRTIPFFALPTTAGTGSEATQFAVVYLNQIKHSLSHPSLIPDVAFLEPAYTTSLPASLTAATGLDAVSQAIESLWSVRSTEESIQWAEQALQLGLEHLETSVLAPTAESRAGMLQASHLAGKAINISRTTAPHALSYTMTIQHQVPHGMAVALSIAPFMIFNSRTSSADLCDPRGMSHHSRVFRSLEEAFHSESIEEAAEKWQEQLVRIGCHTKLQEWGITEDTELSKIIRSVNLERLANNPRQVTEKNLIELLESIR